MTLNSILDELGKCESRISKRRNIIIWGMGNASTLYSNAFEQEKLNIVAYTGNDWKSRNGKYLDHEVIAPSAICDIENPLVVVCVRTQKTFNAINDAISENIDCITADSLFFSLHKDDIVKNYISLEDDYSRYLYIELLWRRMNFIRDTKDLYSDDTYFAFPEFRCLDNDEVYVDMGGGL